MRTRRPAGTREARANGDGHDSVEARLGRLRQQASELAVHIESLTLAYEQAPDDVVTGHLEYLIRLKSRRLDTLSKETAELERTLSAGRTPEPRYAVRPGARKAAGDRSRETGHPGGHDPAHAGGAANGGALNGGSGNHGAGTDGGAPATHVMPHPASRRVSAAGSPGGSRPGRAERTEELISRGRRTSSPRLSRRAIVIGTAAAVALVTILVAVLASSGASWPGSVATVQSEAAKACQNPNLESEPNQVNFACAKNTRQVLWVLALLTSDDNPHFADTKTHRLGLEPIQPAEGGEIAWSLNLHHPYNPDNPIDSLDVAARAINNIVGGATVTGTGGSPVVQSGLESDPANCRRYTGSAAVTARDGFPGLCARPVASLAGQAALVADIYKQWIVGASPQAAQDAAILYENAGNPGEPRVQAILKQLQSPSLRA